MLMIPENMEELRRCLKEHPEHKPAAPLGPGLGLGNRMGFITAISAMMAIGKTGLRASAVQGSVMRELRPELMNGAERYVYYKGIGKVPVGHTGMSIQGEFLESVRERIRRKITAPYVADADHIPVRGVSERDIQKLRELVEESRDRTLFTLDAHFCVDHGSASPEDKFRLMLEALDKACITIEEIKDDEPHAVEISIDECPGLTSTEELSYIVREVRKNRNIRVLFSIAPAVGFDKKDEDGPELRKYLQRTIPSLHAVLHDNGLVMGIHSGDNKTKETLQLIGEATGSEIWYKVSPDRQRQFFRLLESSQDSSEIKLFEEVFDYLVSVVKENSNADDEILATNCRKCLRELAQYDKPPYTEKKIFFDFGFLLMQKYHERLKSLPDAFYQRYFEMDFEYIRKIALALGLIA